MGKSFRTGWGVIGSLLVLLMMLVVAPVGRSQTAGTGALTGTITDPSGAVVPNAMVTASNLDTGQTRTATTGADGTYKINLLTPGNYKVRFEAGGFKPVEIPSAAVNVTETEVLDRTLEVGAQAQTVTVEHFLRAIKDTIPSVTEEAEQEYQKLAQTFKQDSHRIGFRK